MRLIKQFLFIPILSVVFGAQGATPAPTTPQLNSPLNTPVIYSGAAITMGASSIVDGDLHEVEGATLGASAEFGGENKTAIGLLMPIPTLSLVRV